MKSIFQFLVLLQIFTGTSSAIAGTVVLNCEGGKYQVIKEGPGRMNESSYRFVQNKKVEANADSCRSRWGCDEGSRTEVVYSEDLKYSSDEDYGTHVFSGKRTSLYDTDFGDWYMDTVKKVKNPSTGRVEYRNVTLMVECKWE